MSDRREITKIKKRLDAFRHQSHSNLVEKVEDENMDSFTKLKEELDSLRMSVQQQKNGGGIIIERAHGRSRPICRNRAPPSLAMVHELKCEYKEKLFILNTIFNHNKTISFQHENSASLNHVQYDHCLHSPRNMFCIVKTQGVI